MRDRSTLPLMFISSPVDRMSQLWTKRKPTAAVLQRIAMLAQEAHLLVQQQLQHAVHRSDFKVISTRVNYFHMLTVAVINCFCITVIICFMTAAASAAFNFC